MAVAPPLEDARSTLAAARIRRGLSVEETARRAGVAPEAVLWLEEGRVYRFRSPDDALTATLLYASALGISNREARGLAGLPVPSLPHRATGRMVALAAVGAAAAALAVVAVLAFRPAGHERLASGAAAAALPSPWRISVDVLNGSGDINYTRRVASRIGALAYHVQRVGRADRFDYLQTAVYYEPHGEAIGLRLARQLGVEARPLPGGKDPRRLVVIVGPARLTG